MELFLTFERHDGYQFTLQVMHCVLACQPSLPQFKWLWGGRQRFSSASSWVRRGPGCDRADPGECGITCLHAWNLGGQRIQLNNISERNSSQRVDRSDDQQ